MWVECFSEGRWLMTVLQIPNGRVEVFSETRRDTHAYSGIQRSTVLDRHRIESKREYCPRCVEEKQAKENLVERRSANDN